MTIIADYETWKNIKTHDLKTNDGYGTCPQCDGDGYTRCTCCGQISECDECNEDGSIPISEGGIPRVTFKDYFRAVEKDLILYCEWTNSNLFEEMAAFIKQHCQGPEARR